MSETITPTMNLRFVKRRLLYKIGDDISEVRHLNILQQLFHTSKGSEWRDIPIVDEDKLITLTTAQCA